MVAQQIPGRSDDEILAAVARVDTAAEDVARTFANLDPTGLDVDSWQDRLATIGERTAELRAATAQVSDMLGLTSAQQRLLHYLRRHLGEVCSGVQLAGVSGIGDWARRIRELRVEHGWPIESGVQRPGLRRNEYVLVRDSPEVEIAEAWRLAKSIRNQGGSGKNKALAYLKALSPNPADQDQLHYVAKIPSWTRRVRELHEEGWDIKSNIDEPTLAPGAYRLATLERGSTRARRAIKLRYKIMDRDERTCQDCRVQAGDLHVPLQVHHILPKQDGGNDDPDNLVTLCRSCHAGRHALMDGQVPVDELLSTETEPDLR